MSLLPWTLSQGVRRARRGDHVKSEASRAECARPEHLRGFSPPGREQRALTGFIISNGLPVDDRPDEVRVLVAAGAIVCGLLIRPGTPQAKPSAEPVLV